MNNADADVALLTPRLRQVMELVRRGRKPKEISAQLGMTAQHVYVSISAAKKRIATGGLSLYRQQQERDRDHERRRRLEATTCHFGHERRPGRACRQCTDEAKGERIEPDAPARVARELAEGKRCRHPMLSGRPCGLMLPCVHP